VTEETTQHPGYDASEPSASADGSLLEPEMTGLPAPAAEELDSAAAADTGSAPPVKRSRSIGRVAATVGLVVVLLGVAAYGALWVNDLWLPWGRHAMVRTAITGVEALIGGDADALAKVSNSVVKAELTESVRSSMSAKGIMAQFGAPSWKGDSAEVTATTQAGAGAFIAGPAKSGASVVGFQTMGGLSFTNGVILLERTPSGWAITGLTVQASKLPTTAPSASSTSTTPSKVTTP
jgi:hypothetical protein